MPIPNLKNPGPLLVDKVRGYFDRLPPWLRDVITIRVEKQKVDAKVTELDSAALQSELKQEVTDEKLRSNTFLGDGEPGSGNDMSGLPASHPSEVVITGTGQVADVTETVSTSPLGLVEGPPLQDGSSEQVGDVWVTKKVEAPTFDKKVFQTAVEDLLPVEFRAAIPEKTESHVVDGAAAMPTLGPIDLLRKEEQVKVGVKETTVQSRDTTGTKPTLIGQEIDLDFNGATEAVTKSVVPRGTVIGQGFGMAHGSVTPYDDKNSIKETKICAAPQFPVLNQYNYDETLNQSVITQVSIVPAGDTALATPPANALDWNERKIDAVHKMRVVNYPTVAPLEITYETQNFTFPALLLNLDFKLVALATSGRSEVQFTAGTRAAFTIPVKLQINTSWSWSQPQPSAVINWAPGDITFKGVSYQISLSNILYNAWSNIGVTFAADAYYGNIVDRFSISATGPSVTTYISWIGTYQCVSSTVTRYKRMWKKQDTLVLIY
jgi:hypothetical protein